MLLQRRSASRTGLATALAVVLMGSTWLIHPSSAVARCIPGRSSSVADNLWGRGATDTTTSNEIQTIEAEAENDGEYGYYPYVVSGSNSAARLEMYSTYDHGNWYDGAQMIMELQWSSGQGRPQSSVIWTKLVEEVPPHKVIHSATYRLGDLGVGDVLSPKLEIHIHSVSGGEYPQFSVNDIVIWNTPQISAPNGFRYSRMVAHTRNAANQVPGDGDWFNVWNAKWERQSYPWATYPMSYSIATNTWGRIGTSTGAMDTEETWC